MLLLELVDRLPDEKLKILFVDYGNTQITPINECIYLSKELAKYPISAVRCSGVAYLNANRLEPAQIESLLMNGLQADPIIWQSARFIKNHQASSPHPLVSIDELLRVANQVHEQRFDASLYDEPIVKPVKLAPNETLSVRFSSMSGNFKYIYFNLKNQLPGLEQLEKGSLFCCC